jgi:hypothetical protein
MFGLTKFDIAALEQAYAGTGEQPAQPYSLQPDQGWTYDRSETPETITARSGKRLLSV